MWILNIEKIKILYATDPLKIKELADLLAKLWYKSGLMPFTSLLTPGFDLSNFYDIVNCKIDDPSYSEIRAVFSKALHAWVLDLEEILLVSGNLKAEDIAESVRMSWYKSELYVLHIKMMSDKMLFYSFDHILDMHDLTKLTKAIMDFDKML